MLATQNRLLFQLNQFYNDRVVARNVAITKSIRDVCKLIQDVLREVEAQEPRFVSSLADAGGGQYDGLRVLSPTEFEVVLYLNQMGIFNFVDDGTLPGCAVLKLSDGRKRSMSLWVEFITASGYLSARKIRSRFQTLVAAAADKCGGGAVKVVSDATEVRLRVRDRYCVEITPAFRCTGLWPRSAAHWPQPPPSAAATSQLPLPSWPSPALVADVKSEGFELLSKESPYAVTAGQRDKQTSADGDAWTISFHQVCTFYHYINWFTKISGSTENVRLEILSRLNKNSCEIFNFVDIRSFAGNVSSPLRERESTLQLLPFYKYPFHH